MCLFLNQIKTMDKKDTSTQKQEPSILSTDFSEDSVGAIEYELDYLYSDRDSVEGYPGVERLHYDYTAERHTLYPTNIWESLAHMVKTCLGVGFLGIHEGYMHGGIWTSLAASGVITVIATYNMLSLASSAHTMYERLRVPKLTYPDLVEVTVKYGPLVCMRKSSKAFRYAVDTCLFIDLCSVCCFYHIMIASTLRQTLEVTSTYMADLSLDLRIYIVIVFLPIMMICFVRSLKCLAPFSLVADVFIVLCAFVSIYYSMRQAQAISKVPGWKSVRGLFRFSGVYMYSIDGITMVLPVENYMKAPKYIPFVIQTGMFIVVILTTFVGFFGYWGWGEQCQTPIMINMPIDTGTIILRVLLMSMFTITYAVHFWVPFRVAWRYLGKKVKRKRLRCERVYRMGLVVIICIISVTLPDLSFMMSFVGNIFIAFLTFIFPAFIEALICWRRNSRFRYLKLLKNLSIMMFGATLSIGALYTYQEQEIDNAFIIPKI